MNGYARRRAALAAALPEPADAMVVTALVNVRYLTGFTGSNAALLVHRDGTSLLATDGRYATQVAGEVPDVELLVTNPLARDLVRRAHDAGASRVAIERHDVTLAAFDRITAGADGVEFVDAGMAVERLRMVKDDDELAALARACAITDEVFTAVLPTVRAGVTEREVAWALESAMHERGAEPAFESIVAFGANSARPHHRPTDRSLEPGDLVKLDFGARHDGYHADMTRTVALGPVRDWQRDLHDLVRAIQARAREAALPGALPADLDADVRRQIEDAGHTVAHGLGHGVGLEVHELPFVGRESSAEPLAERVPVTVEPGIYLPGRGGVRIEDTVVVQADGAHPLTTSPRELLVL